MANQGITGYLSLKQQLQVLAMKPGERKRLAKGMAREVKKNSRQRLRGQRNLDGSTWAPRKGSSRKKMLRGLNKHLMDYATPDKAVVRFRGGVGRIAAEHQKGVSTTMTAQKAQKIYGEPDYEAPATKSQARALKEAGYKRPRKGGKGFSRASMKWIQQNLSQGQAGLVLRILTDEDPKQSWVIELPSRSFLGTTEQERRELVQQTFEKTRAQMKAAKR